MTGTGKRFSPSPGGGCSPRPSPSPRRPASSAASGPRSARRTRCPSASSTARSSSPARTGSATRRTRSTGPSARRTRRGLPPALRTLEPLPLLLALNQRCAAAEREGRPIVGSGLPPFCDGDARFFSDDCLRMPAPDGTPVEGGKFTAEMEFVGHTEVTEEDYLAHLEGLERAAAIDREIYGDDF